MVFTEGEEWKRKRKILNSVFNYNFVKNVIPKMISICNKNFDDLEEKARDNESKGY